MLEKGIPTEVMGQFLIPETEAGTPEEKLAFVNQMDKLLTKEQILSIMQEQGCQKTEHTADVMLKLKGKPIEERVKIMEPMFTATDGITRIRLNSDGQLSVYWAFTEENGKYRCVCPIMEKLSKSAAVSLTFCGCCSGHIKYHFEQDLEVKLRLIDTVSSALSSSGEKYCEHLFEIL